MGSTALKERIGFLGAGRMATALARGFANAGCVPQRQMLASDPYADSRDRFAQEVGVRVVQSNGDVVKDSDVLFLSIKPQQMAEVLREIAPAVTAKHLVISIAAGVPLSAIEGALGSGRRVVRVMPNTPCLIGEGASAFALGASATDADAALVERLLATVGTAVKVSESLLDVVTGLSGSGPAYVYQFIEALSDGGVKMGLPRAIATQLAAQTVLGAAKMVTQTGEHPGTLKDAVTSPGGTTIAGLHALEQGGLRGTVMNAVEAATLRSRELGKSS